MDYLEFLGRLHALLEPEAYLEIGVRGGHSLALAQCPAVGIDPAYDLKVDLGPAAHLFRETSDEYFLRPWPRSPLGGRRADLAFIDGMHLAEFALRDFTYVERHSHWGGVAVFDDIFPRDAEEAARDRRTRAWTGDVYKLLGILERERPDLVVWRVDTEPTGLGVVLNLDPSQRALEQRYHELAKAIVVPDPQVVPEDILERRGAIDPETVLASPVWRALRRARGKAPRPGRRALRNALRRERLRRRLARGG